VGFHEESVFVERYLEHLRESFYVFLGLHGRRENDSVRRNLDLSIKNVVTDGDSDLLFIIIFDVFDSRLFVIFVSDEYYAQISGLLVVLLVETVGSDITVEDDDVPEIEVG